MLLEYVEHQEIFDVVCYVIRILYSKVSVVTIKLYLLLAFYESADQHIISAAEFSVVKLGYVRLG